MDKQKIGVIGSGDVAQRLGEGFAAAGHEVKLGTRDAKKLEEWKSRAGARASVGSFAEAAAFGEIVLLCTAWSGTQSALELAGVERLAGKLVVDVTNPLDFSRGFPPRLATGPGNSGGEEVQRWLPNSRVVKAWNIVGNAHMVNPEFPTGKPDLLICGNDEAAKKTVDGLGRELGWPPAIDVGGIDASHYLEAMCILWVLIMAKNGNGNHAFAVLRK
jgi:8-hydroxy-5-deazaflavin:NADPH oxidoreductase